MPYTQNTSGTTGDGILQALSDIALGEDHRPYVTNTSGVTLNALLTVLTDVAFGSVTALVRNTTGTLLDIAIDALVAIRDGDTVPAFNPALYGNTTMAGFVARLVDVANGSDSSPYPALNTSGVTLNGWVEALDEAIANGTIGEAHLVLSANTVAENASNGTTVGTASIAGDYTGTPSYSLTDDAGGKFAINSSSGVVTKAAALDYETATSHSITVAVSGTTPDPDNRSFTINVTNVVEDTTPDAFELGSAVTGASLSTRVYTAPITISGTDGPNDLVIDGTATSKEYRINGGAWLPVSGTLPQVVNSDVVEASGLTSGSYSTAITISVTAGGNVTSATTDTFTVTTLANPLSEPDAPQALALSAASDSGVSNSDRITNINTPQFDITADVQVGWFIQAYVDGAAYGDPYEIQSGEAGNGVEITIPVDALPDGTYDITFTIENGAGEGDPYSPAIEVTIDTAPPTVSSFNPADGATSVAVGATTAVTFNQAVAFTASVDIGFYKTNDDTLIEAFDETDIGSTLNISGSVLTITHTNFAGSTGVYGLIDASSLIDIAGNAFAGVTAKTTWDFTTASTFGLGTAGRETASGSGTTYDSTARTYPAGMTVIGFAGNCATNYDLVSLKFHSPDVATDPTGTAVTVTYKSGGLSGFTQMVFLAAKAFAVPTAGVFRAIYDNAGMFFVKTMYQNVTGGANVTDGSSSVQSGASIICQNPGVIVSLMFADGSSLSNTTWAGTGATETFDESINAANQWWSGATYSTPGTIAVSFTQAGSPSVTRGAAIAIGA